MQSQPPLGQQSWDDRHANARKVFVPWIERVKPLKGARVLEFGSGQGACAAAWALAGATVTGFDIHADDTKIAREHAARLNVRAEFHAGTFAELIARARVLSGKIDVFMLYAVLEHMTVEERLMTLQAARITIAPDGIIVVAESPNRAHWFDHHTSMTPLFDQLPDELAFYEPIRRENMRANFVQAAAQAPNEGSLTRTRLGRGIGHQEFERVFASLAPITALCNWEPEILTHSQGVEREHLALARFMERQLPDVPASFSRYYIDLIIRPDGKKTPYVRPSTPKARAQRTRVMKPSSSPLAAISSLSRPNRHPLSSSGRRCGRPAYRAALPFKSTQRRTSPSPTPRGATTPSRRAGFPMRKLCYRRQQHGSRFRAGSKRK
jgi:S-adenosylmethionine-dependent methyltransferase